MKPGAIIKDLAEQILKMDACLALLQASQRLDLLLEGLLEYFALLWSQKLLLFA